MKVLAKTCPGHESHDTVAGYHPDVGQVSKFVARYTPQVVQAVLDTVPSFRHHTVDMLEGVENHFCDDHFWPEVMAVAKKPEPTDSELKQTLLKVHRNLGHPGNADLIRILKHGQASEKAIAMAKDLECPVCQRHAQPISSPSCSDKSCQRIQLADRD